MKWVAARGYRFRIRLSILILALFVWGNWSQISKPALYAKGNGAKMTKIENFQKKFDRLDANDLKGADALAKDLQSELEEVTRFLLARSRSENLDESRKASYVLLGLGLHVFDPMIRSLQTENIDRYRWEIETLTEWHQQNQNTLEQVLRARLSDLRKVPLPLQEPQIEERLPDRRICDEAYLSLVQLRNPKMSEDEKDRLRIEFFDLNEKGRDQKIRAIR